MPVALTGANETVVGRTNRVNLRGVRLGLEIVKLHPHVVLDAPGVNLGGDVKLQSGVRIVFGDGTILSSAMGAAGCTYNGHIYSPGSVCVVGNGTPNGLCNSPLLIQSCGTDGTWTQSQTCQQYSLVCGQ